MPECLWTDRVHLLADGDLKPDGEQAEAVRGHLLDCRACQSELTWVISLGGLIRAWAGVAVDFYDCDHCGRFRTPHASPPLVVCPLCTRRGGEPYRLLSFVATVKLASVPATSELH